jgi:hypothetical protein
LTSRPGGVSFTKIFPFGKKGVERRKMSVARITITTHRIGAKDEARLGPRALPSKTRRFKTISIWDSLWEAIVNAISLGGESWAFKRLKTATQE